MGERIFSASSRAGGNDATAEQGPPQCAGMTPRGGQLEIFPDDGGDGLRDHSNGLCDFSRDPMNRPFSRRLLPLALCLPPAVLMFGLSWADAVKPQSKPQAQPARGSSAPDVKSSKSSEAESPSLPPAESLKKLHVPNDLKIEQVLAEPVVKQPLHLGWDERGRLWVVQFIQYPYPAGLKMVSKDRFWRAVYDKVPPAPPNHDRGLDRITIHEDTTGDGKYDKETPFVEGTNITTACERGRGGVWVLNPPYLLFYPDANQDDVPDGPPVVHLAGFGIEDTHSTANSLRWGPDGWLYGCLGSTVSGNVIRPGLDKKGVYSQGQCVWRYHPETRVYEIFAEGGGNAFGLEFDDQGRVFSGHNGGDTRGFHYVQGGYYAKGFGKHGPLSNPFTFGYFGPMGHHPVQRFTHNFVIYGGGTFPARHNGKLFGVEPIQGRIVESEVSADRSSFQARDIDFPVWSDDRRFRPVEIKVGPDGAIYIADMHEPHIAHGQHFSGNVDKTTGRIYRLQGKNVAPIKPFNLGTRTTRELVDFLKHENRWFRQTALRLLADRRDPNIIPFLLEETFQNQGQYALECFWALNLSGGLTDEVALRALSHPDPFIRLWTVRLLGDKKQLPSRAIADKLVALATSEPSVFVRSQLASTAKRLPGPDGLAIVRQLLTHSEDVTDVHIPLLLWWAMESKAESHRAEVVALFRDKSIWQLPLVRTHLVERVMQRYAKAGTRTDLLICAELFALSPDKSSTGKLMKGFEAAYQGRTLSGLPTELVTALTKAGGGSLSLRVRQGNEAAVEEALKLIADAKTPKPTQIEFIKTFGEVSQPKSVPVLLSLLAKSNDSAIRLSLLNALMSYRDDAIGVEVVRLYPQLDTDSQVGAQTLLASRPAWSKLWLQAIDAGKIDGKKLPLDIVRQMTLHTDPVVVGLIKKHWSNLQGASSADMQKQMARYTALLARNDMLSDPKAGKKLYSATCGKCHILFDEGGNIGPNLTNHKRDDVNNLLLNIVNPSAEIREGFESYIVVTEDGRTVTGFLFDRDNKVVVLRGVDGQNITIPRDKIEEMVPQKKSLMPEGLLKDLTDQQIRDLFAYIRSSQPISY